MKLKSLLLGSTAALMTITAAQAADAIVEQAPEPDEYVKVCDTYGAGFFYIPGTETCLGLSGEVRFQYEATDSDAGSSGDAYWHARVNVDVRNETDYGTLRSYIRLEGDGDNDNKAENFGPLDTYIEIAGLSMGYRTSRVELTGLPGLMHDGSYFGGGRTWYADYTFSASDLTIMGGLSSDNGEIAPPGEDDSFDFYVRGDYSNDMFAVGASYGHDTSEKEGAMGVYATANVVDNLTIQGYFNTQDASTQFGGDGGETQKFGIGASFNVTDDVSIAGGYYEIDVENDMRMILSVIPLAWTGTPPLTWWYVSVLMLRTQMLPAKSPTTASASSATSKPRA